MLRLDLHVHTHHSEGGLSSLEDIVKVAKAKGLDGIAITDHDTIDAHQEAMKFSERDFLMILGLEVSSTDGHILGLGIHKPIPPKLSPKKTVSLIRKQGGIAICAHPFNPFARGQKPGIVYKAKFDAIEVLNSRALFLANPLARWFAEKNHLPMTAGSDAHHCNDVGMASTVLNCDAELDSILNEIKGGGTSISGQTLPLSRYLRRVLQKTSARFVRARRGGGDLQQPRWRRAKQVGFCRLA